jgi:hypothetical protein
MMSQKTLNISIIACSQREFATGSDHDNHARIYATKFTNSVTEFNDVCSTTKYLHIVVTAVQIQAEIMKEERDSLGRSRRKSGH